MAFYGRTPVPLITAALLLGTLLVYELFAPKGERTDIALYPDDLQMIEDGEKLYAEHCASCHGPNLAGENNWRERKSNGRLPAPPHDETGHTWHHDSRALFNMTKHGPQFVAGDDYQSDMPAFRDILTDREIVQILSFIKSTWPAKVRETHDEIERRAKVK